MLSKDLWSMLFGRAVDRLKTNNRGLYALVVNRFIGFLDVRYIEQVSKKSPMLRDN